MRFELCEILRSNGAMIYTVGSQKAYLRKLVKEGRVMKSGRCRGYAGGCAFKTRADAQRYLEELSIQGYKDYMVFGLLASWDKDTRESPDHWWRDLLKDAEVVVLEKEDLED